MHEVDARTGNSTALNPRPLCLVLTHTTRLKDAVEQKKLFHFLRNKAAKIDRRGRASDHRTGLRRTPARRRGAPWQDGGGAPKGHARRRAIIPAARAPAQSPAASLRSTA